MKIDPIIAVKDVEKSSKWYQLIFECDAVKSQFTQKRILDKGPGRILFNHN